MLTDVATVLAVGEGNLERAAVLAGAADAIHDRNTRADFTPLRSVPTYQWARSAVDQGLGEAAFEKAHAAGAALPPEEVVRMVAAVLG